MLQSTGAKLTLLMYITSIRGILISQGYLDGGDTTDEADDSGCGGVGGGNQEDHHPLMMIDEDGSAPNKRHKLSPALSSSGVKGMVAGVGVGVPGLDGEVEGQFICDQCDKAFSKQSSLARHKYEHSGKLSI